MYHIYNNNIITITIINLFCYEIKYEGDILKKIKLTFFLVIIAILNYENLFQTKNHL